MCFFTLVVNVAVTIIVDADACPVKQEIAAIGKQYACEVTMVASYDHALPHQDGIRIIQVDRSDQSVDLYIANRLTSQHVLITQDFGLATLGLAKGAVVLSNRGQIYKDESIDFLLERRHAQAKKRRSGKHTRGPKPFTEEDRDNFRQNLIKVLERLQEINYK